MKRLFLLLAVLALLAGCALNEPEQTTAPTTQPTVAPQPTMPEDPGLYDPDSTIEDHTHGAVRAYPLEQPYPLGIRPMGEDLLLFSGNDMDTILTRLSGERCVTSNTRQVYGSVYPDMGCIRVSEDQVAYYDMETRSVIFLNDRLLESERIVMPEDMQGTPVISEDFRTVYYCTADQVRALDLDMGVSRLLRQQECQWQEPQQVLFSGSILECYMVEHDGDTATLYISTQTGELLGRDDDLYVLNAWEERYFIKRSEGYLDELLFDDGNGTLKTFNNSILETVYGMPYLNGALGVLRTEENREYSYYDLESGKKTAFLSMPGYIDIFSMMPDATGRYIWMLGYDAATQKDTLYRWELAASPVEDDTVYTSRRYTAEDPDTEGLALLQEEADRMGEKYGVKILLGDQVPQPWDYTFTYEYRVPAFAYALEELDKALSAYPEGFWERAVSNTEAGVLRIGLVRDISDDVAGLQYWQETDALVGLEIGFNLEQSAYHELCHVLDSYIISNSYAYDDWEELNPEGVHYDYNYEDYKIRDYDVYMHGDERVFIDNYAMSYPKEDRARIMEYAMRPENEEMFQSETMQKKLLCICQGIRECFGLEKSSETYLWEQYLETPLAYVKK